MKETVQKRFKQTTAALMAVAVVLSVLGSMGTVGAAPGVLVTQTADSTTVTPGETIQFTTTLNVDSLDTSGAGLAVDLPEGWTIVEQTSENAQFKASANEWLWFVPGGIAGDQTATYTVQVPEDASTGDHSVAVTGLVSQGGESLTTTDQTQITVQKEQSNSAPAADAGADQTVDEDSEVTLDASGSTDSDGDQLGYTWTQTAGPSVSLSGADTAAPTFTAPAVDSDTTLTFEVEVADGNGGSGTDTVDITVQPVVEAPDPASFQVSNLNAPESTTQGDSVTVSATIENVGDETATQTVVFTLDGSTLDSQSVTLAGGASQTVTFDLDTTGVDPSAHTYGVSTADDDATGQITVATPADPDADAVSVSVEPADATVVPGETTTFDVVVDSDDVGAVDLTVSLSDGSVATIESVDTPANDSKKDITNDGQTATIEAYDLQSAGQDDSTTVATVTVAGTSAGTTTLSLGAVGVSDVQGNAYDATAAGDASLTVSFPALSGGLEPPTNLDDDAVLEDVNGDGVFNAADAQALFVNRNSDLVQNNPEQFDFNGDGSVNVNDAQAAFYQAVFGGAN